jgi:hypothetical protein
VLTDFPNINRSVIECRASVRTASIVLKSTKNRRSQYLRLHVFYLKDFPGSCHEPIHEPANCRFGRREDSNLHDITTTGT